MSRFRGKRRRFEFRYLPTGLSLGQLFDFIESVPDDPEAHRQNAFKLNDAVKDVIAYGEIAVMPVIERLLPSENRWIEWAAIWALRDIGDPRAIKPLWAIYQNSPNDLGIQHIALITLGQLKDGRVFDEAITLLNQANSHLRDAAIYALGNLADSRSLEVLNRLTQDSDPEIRVVALSALGRALTITLEPNAESIAFFIGILNQREITAAGSGQIGHVRQYALDVLAQIDHPKARAAVRAAFTHSKHDVRRHARRLLQPKSDTDGDLRS